MDDHDVVIAFIAGSGVIVATAITAVLALCTAVIVSRLKNGRNGKNDKE
jgi:hypothetical protein